MTDLPLHWDLERQQAYWIEWYDTGNNEIPTRHYVDMSKGRRPNRSVASISPPSRGPDVHEYRGWTIARTECYPRCWKVEKKGQKSDNHGWRYHETVGGAKICIDRYVRGEQI